MPELPEVETIKRQLESVLIGQEITSINVLHAKSWFGIEDNLIKGHITAIKRKAKVLFLQVSHKQDNVSHLMVHLKMTGQLIYQPDDRNRGSRIVGGHPTNSWYSQLPDKHTRVVILLNQGTLYFNDQRLFGWIKVVDELRVNELISRMPLDIIDDECNESFFYQTLQRSTRPVKILIMDSQLIGGVGNIYANDALFDARIDPRRPAKSLTRKESNQLLSSLKKIINLGIELGGATAGDGKFVHTTGTGGKYQDHFLVYERAGQDCINCGQSIIKLKLGERGTYLCLSCQK